MDRDSLAAMPEAAPAAAVVDAAPAGAAGAGAGPAATPSRPAHIHLPAGRAFQALHTPAYRRYFYGQIASVSGTFLQSTALGWLVLQLTGSATALGLVLAAGSLPTLVLGAWGGALVDRWDLRRLLIITQILFGVLAALLWIAAVAGAASVGLLVAVGVASGLVAVVDSPARQAFAGLLVPPDELASAVSLNGVVVNSARVVGPAVAGVLIATVGTTPCFAVNAISYLAVIAALLTIRTVPPRQRGPARGGVRDGLRYARTKPQLWLPLAMMSLVGLLAFNFAVVLPVLARDDLHGGGGTYGLISAALSVGSVLGSLGVGMVPHPRRIYLAAAAVAFGVGLIATAAAGTVPLVSAALVVTGLAAFSFVTMSSTALQLHAEPQYRGRIMALFGLVYLGATPLGSPLTGWIISIGGSRAALLTGAAACLVAGIGAWFVHAAPAPELPPP